MDTKQLERLASYNLESFVESFINDKSFKSSLNSSIAFL